MRFYIVAGALLSVILLQTLAKKLSPFVVLPPYIKQNATNSITVTPVKGSSNNVDIDVSIYGTKESQTSIVFTQKLKAKKAGSSYTISFDVKNVINTVTVNVKIDGHEKFENELLVKPDLAMLHLHTDKKIYRAADTVKVRALPLTHSGAIFKHDVEFALVNPDKFELVRKTHSADQSFIPVEFVLPEHLFYGDWSIVARPFGIRDPDMTYTTLFRVTDYVLPPFHISASVAEGEALNTTEVSVEARYFYGAPISGTLSFSCAPTRKNHTSSSRHILQSQIVDGSWRQSIDMTSCFEIDQRSSTTVIVEIRDRGTGNRGETQLQFDPLASKFDLVPLRPVFNENTKSLLFVTHATGAAQSSSIVLEFVCITSARKPNMKMAVKLGEIVVFDIPLNWKECPVIMVKAERQLRGAKSRAKVLMIPSVPESASIDASWIKVQHPQANYKVGEKLVAKLPENKSRELNYMILCNSASVTKVGRVRDDGSFSLTLTRQMMGKCVLFVYSTKSSPVTDMLQFYVTEPCQGSTFVSRQEVQPGQNVTFTMNGEPYGLVVLRSLDDRLNVLAVKNEPVISKNWDFSIFNRPEKKLGQPRLVNFVNIKEVKAALTASCQLVAPSYLNSFGKCPDAGVSTSCVSNFCQKVMLEKCMTPELPTMSSSCDPKNPKSCGRKIMESSSLAARILTWKKPSLKPMSTQDMFSDTTDFPEEEDYTKPRENFHEVWLFDSFKLGASGTASKAISAPDTIGKWSTSSVFWAPGQTELCSAPNVDIISKKNVFMDIDLPRSVYINETITVKISVSSLNVKQETKYAICMRDMSRKVCADLGSFGQHGRPTYTRVVVSPENPTDTKTFTMRFLVTGPTSVVFTLREETSYPGKHHCDVGTVFDTVKLHLNIAKRAETEEHYKRLILNADKPLAKVAFSDSTDGEMPPPRDILEVFEFRSLEDPSAVTTQIFSHILDTDTVYSFTIDISKFLPSTPLVETSARVKRGVLDYGNSFLTDVLKKVSVELYQFKRAKMNENADVSLLERSENKIGSLLSDMLRFSDCANETACGFSEYGRPANKRERSPLLTAMASSLLCEASADERLVCGAVKSLQDYLKASKGHEHVDLHDLIDIEHPVDKKWFLNSMLLQVSKDCAAYQCVKSDTTWGQLYLSFYDMDESWRFDDRSLAALAFMGTNATGEVMRIKMSENIHNEMLPFWSAGHALRRSKVKSSTFDEIYRQKRMKSGDVLVNSLGILAFISAGAEGKSVDWDPLADWVYEQQGEDGTYNNALDTYIASRALYEYRFRKVDIQNDGNLQVTVSCAGCETRTLNVTESASEIYLPTNIRNVTLTTKGHGKVKAGVRVLATKRQRSRRGLTQDDYYPVRITVDQEKVVSGTIKQIVCLRVTSPVLKKIEITHGFFTGYTAKPNSIDVLANSTQLSLLVEPAISSFAAHFVLQGLRQSRDLCYEIGVTEPDHSHEPFYLAPVAIAARHPVSDVVGLVLISHPDQNRLRRSATIPTDSRPRRGIIDESIDTVCFAGGMCSCAETSCGVQCGMCARDSPNSLKALFGNQDEYGMFVKVESTERRLVESSYYSVFKTKVLVKMKGLEIVAENVTIWLRDCNKRCLPKEGVKTGNILVLIVNVDAFTVDSEGSQHYVLRDTDRMELSSNGDCKSLTAEIVASA